MSIFHRKTMLERMADQVARVAKKAPKSLARTGLLTAGTAVGVTAAGSALSSMRKSHDQ